MTKIPAYLFIVIILTSCQMRKIAVDLHTPSKLVFPPEVRTLLVTSRYVPATGDYEYIQWGAYESVDSLRWRIAESVVDTLALRLTERDHFLVKKVHYPRMLRHNAADLPDPQPWEGMATLAKKEYVQAVLIIESFNIKKSEVRETEENGAFKAGFTVEVDLGIRVYEPEKRRLLDSYIYTFPKEFQSSGETHEAAKKSLPADTLSLYLAAGSAATTYADWVLPRGEKAMRRYYARGDSLMLVADEALREGKWGRAESKWNWLAYNSPDTTVQALASYNMALACERDGRLNQAAGFARRSNRLKPDTQTIEYIKILEDRMLESDNRIKDGLIIRRW